MHIIFLSPTRPNYQPASTKSGKANCFFLVIFSEILVIIFGDTGYQFWGYRLSISDIRVIDFIVYIVNKLGDTDIDFRDFGVSAIKMFWVSLRAKSNI